MSELYDKIREEITEKMREESLEEPAGAAWGEAVQAAPETAAAPAGTSVPGKAAASASASVPGRAAMPAGAPEMSLEGSPKTRKGAERRIRTLLLVCGVLLVVMLVCYFAGTLYLKKLEPEKDPVVEAGNIIDEDEAAKALEEERAKEELRLRLMAEYELGIKDGEEKILEELRVGLSDGKTLVDTIRPLYPDELVVAGNGRYHFIPIDDSLKKNHYAEENLNILDSGEIQYLTDGEVTSHKGIDVSKFQGKIDWEKVAKDGVEFAFIRAGYRGYGTKGTLVTDDMAEKNIKGANDAGVKVGVYFYTQATTKAEILEEVQLVLDLIEPYRIECPIVIDVEKTDANGRMNALDVEKRTELVKLFCDTVAAAGYRPMLYYNLEMGALMLDIAQLEEYDKWFAYWREDFYYPYDFKIWQYSDQGKVDGINTEVDLDIAFEPIWEE